MYRLQVKTKRGWRWGLHDYTLTEAQQRLQEVQAAGVTARIQHISKLLEPAVVRNYKIDRR